MIGLPFEQIVPSVNDDESTIIAKAIEIILRRCDQEPIRTFDPYSAAHLLRIEVKFVTRVDKRALSGSGGRLRIERDGILVELPKHCAHARRRFTLAHELAHLCFVEHGAYRRGFESVHVEAKTSEDIEERICNRVAAELLMPSTTFRRAAEWLFMRAGARPSAQDVVVLAREFDVSIVAARKRLIELKLWKGRRPTLKEARDLASGRSGSFSLSYRTHLPSYIFYT